MVERVDRVSDADCDSWHLCPAPTAAPECFQGTSPLSTCSTRPEKIGQADCCWERCCRYGDDWRDQFCAPCSKPEAVFIADCQYVPDWLNDNVGFNNDGWWQYAHDRLNARNPEDASFIEIAHAPAYFGQRLTAIAYTAPTTTDPYGDRDWPQEPGDKQRGEFYQPG